MVQTCFASKRDIEKYQIIMTLLIVKQIKESDYMRQYVWDTGLSASKIWMQFIFLQYKLMHAISKSLFIR